MNYALLDFLRELAPKWDDALRVVGSLRLIGEAGTRRQVVVLESGQAVRKCACGYRVLVEAVPGRNVVPQVCGICRKPMEWEKALRERDPKTTLYVPAPGSSGWAGAPNLKAEDWWCDFGRWALAYRTASVPKPDVLVRIRVHGQGADKPGQPPTWRTVALALAVEMHMAAVPQHRSVLYVWNRLRDGYEG